MRNCKRFLKMFIITALAVFVFNSAPVFAAFYNVAVIPVESSSDVSSYSIYPNAVNMVGDDIRNTLLGYPSVNVLPITETSKKIQNSTLNSEYKNFLKEYKENYTYDYEYLAKLADLLNVNYIIFISGGFDTQRSVLRDSFLYDIQFLWKPSISPAVYFGTMVSVVNVSKQAKIFEKVYSKNFKMADFENPSQYFSENIVPVKSLKNYSKKLGSKASKDIYLKMFPDYVDPNDHIQNVNNFFKRNSKNEEVKAVEVKKEVVVEAVKTLPDVKEDVKKVVEPAQEIVKEVAKEVVEPTPEIQKIEVKPVEVKTTTQDNFKNIRKENYKNWAK